MSGQTCLEHHDCRSGVAWAMESCFDGVCSCTHVFGYGGALCNEPSASAGVNAGILSIPIGLAVILLRLTTPTLLDVLSIRGVFKLNAAGKTYLLSWIGFAVTCAMAGLSIGAAFNPSLYPYVLVLDNLALVFVFAGILSITNAFIRLTSIRVMRHVPIYRQKLIWAMVIQAGGVIVLFYVVDWRTYSLVMFCLLIIAGCCGGIFPLVLFFRSVEKNPDVRRPDILKAALSEYIIRNGASAQFFVEMDPRRTSKLLKEGNGSRNSSRNESEFTESEPFKSALQVATAKEAISDCVSSAGTSGTDQTSPQRTLSKQLSSKPNLRRSLSKQSLSPSDPPSLPRTLSKQSLSHHSLSRTSSRQMMEGTSEQQHKKTLPRSLSMTSFKMSGEKALEKAIFFLRLIHLGANMSLSMAGLIGYWIAYLLFVSSETPNNQTTGTISTSVIFWSLRSCNLLCACFSMILFTQRLYQRRAKQILEERQKAKNKRTIVITEETRLQIAPWLVQSDTLAKDIHISTVKATSTKRIVHAKPNISAAPSIMSTGDFSVVPVVDEEKSSAETLSRSSA